MSIRRFLTSVLSLSASGSNDNHNNNLGGGANRRAQIDPVVISNTNENVNGVGAGFDAAGGGDDWDLDGDDNDFGFDGMDMALDFLDEYQSRLEACGVELNAVFGDDDGSEGGGLQDANGMDNNGGDGDMAMMDPFALLESLKLSEPCTKAQEETMRDALLQYQDCSGYELLQLDETLLGSLTGVITKCASSVSALDIVSMNLPQACASALLGHHPLGQALRDVLLHPGTTGKCMETLSQQVPMCSVDLWPFPVDGKSLQMGSCLSQAMEGIWTDLCVAGLPALDACLPDASTIVPGECDQYMQQCGGQQESLFAAVITAYLPSTIRGMPLPDACQHGPEVDSLAVTKYEAYRTVCAPAGKAFWEELEGGAGAPKLETFEDFLHPDGTSDGGSGDGAAVASSPANSLDPALNTMEQEEQEPQDDDNDSKSGGGHTFGFGVLTGVLLVAAGYAALVVVRKRMAGERFSYGGYSLDLSGPDATAAGGSGSDLEMKPTYSDDSGDSSSLA